MVIPQSSKISKTYSSIADVISYSDRTSTPHSLKPKKLRVAQKYFALRWKIGFLYAAKYQYEEKVCLSKVQKLFTKR